MSGDDSSGSDNRLLALYRRFLGEPESELGVYVGFALFFGGLALAALGFLVFLWNVSVPRDTTLFVRLREIAIALAALGLPAFVLSIVVLLPVRRLVVAAGGVGALAAASGVVVFVATYPEYWNVPGRVDYSVQGIVVYAAGFALLAGTTGSALVGHHLERARATAPASAGDAAPGSGANGSDAAATADEAAGETVTDEQVRRDIEEAVGSAELTWGGVQKTQTRRLKIDTGGGDDGIDYSGFDPDTATTARSEGVDDAVAGLRRMQGGGPESGTGEGTDDQTAALQALKEQREAADAPADGESVVERVRDRLGL